MHLRERPWHRGMDAWDAAMRRVADDRTGLIAFAITAVAGLLLSLALYVVLGWPARFLTSLILRIPEPDCAYNEGLAGWMCGAWLASLSVTGAAVFLIAMFVFRARIRQTTHSVAQRLPPSLRFLERPVVAMLVFLIGWSGIEFHFFGRTGFIPDGVFPMVVGLAVFSLGQWGHRVKPVMGPFWQLRDRLPRVGRIAVLLGIPLLLSLLLTTFLHAPKRDQLLVIVGVLLSWALWTKAGKSSGLLAASLVVAVLSVGTAAADGHCENLDTVTSDFRACERAHHNAAMGVASAGIGIAATAVATARDEEGSTDDPCGGVAAELRAARGQWEQQLERCQSLERFILRLEEQYRVRNESMFWGQAFDVGMFGASFASAGGALGRTAMDRARGIVTQAAAEAVAKEALQRAMTRGHQTDFLAMAHGLANKVGHDNWVQHTQHAVRNAFTDARAAELVKQGFAKGSPEFRKMMAEWTKHANAMTKFVGDTVGMAGKATGLVTMFNDYAQLKDFGARIHKMRLHLIDMEDTLATLHDAITPAQHALENCRERVAMGLKP